MQYKGRLQKLSSNMQQFMHKIVSTNEFSNVAAIYATLEQTISLPDDHTHTCIYCEPIGFTNSETNE